MEEFLKKRDALILRVERDLLEALGLSAFPEST